MTEDIVQQQQQQTAEPAVPEKKPRKPRTCPVRTPEQIEAAKRKRLDYLNEKQKQRMHKRLDELVARRELCAQIRKLLDDFEALSVLPAAPAADTDDALVQSSE